MTISEIKNLINLSSKSVDTLMKQYEGCQDDEPIKEKILASALLAQENIKKYMSWLKEKQRLNDLVFEEILFLKTETKAAIKFAPDIFAQVQAKYYQKVFQVLAMYLEENESFKPEYTFLLKHNIFKEISESLPADLKKLSTYL